MNKTISMEEITSLYKKCGISPTVKQSNRTEINTGSMNNKLNCTFSAMSAFKTTLSLNTKVAKK